MENNMNIRIGQFIIRDMHNGEKLDLKIWEILSIVPNPSWLGQFDVTVRHEEHDGDEIVTKISATNIKYVFDSKQEAYGLVTRYIAYKNQKQSLKQQKRELNIELKKYLV